MGQQQKFQKQFKSVEIKANYTCNSKCDYCCISNNQHKRSMSHEEITSNVIFFKDKYGIEEICLSGGEPTIHEGFLANLNFICTQGLRVYLHTNGIKFHDGHFAGAWVRGFGRTWKNFVAATVRNLPISYENCRR